MNEHDAGTLRALEANFPADLTGRQRYLSAVELAFLAGALSRDAIDNVGPVPESELRLIRSLRSPVRVILFTQARQPRASWRRFS